MARISLPVGTQCSVDHLNTRAPETGGTPCRKRHAPAAQNRQKPCSVLTGPPCSGRRGRRFESSHSDHLRPEALRAAASERGLYRRGANDRDAGAAEDADTMAVPRRSRPAADRVQAASRAVVRHAGFAYRRDPGPDVGPVGLTNRMVEFREAGRVCTRKRRVPAPINDMMYAALVRRGPWPRPKT
jgi:hypothetical protein